MVTSDIFMNIVVLYRQLLRQQMDADAVSCWTATLVLADL